MRVTIHYQAVRRRSRRLGTAAAYGVIEAGTGDAPYAVENGPADPKADAVIMYGLSLQHLALWHEYRARGIPVFTLDLGFFGRDKPGLLVGQHKVAFNAFHPGAEQMAIARPSDRWDALGLEIGPRVRPAQANSPILVAGSGPKSAPLYGFSDHQEWDRATISRLQAITRRPIIYRPKPGYDGEAKPIPGTIWSGREDSITDLIAMSWCVVTHHSVACAEAWRVGVPGWAADGPCAYWLAASPARGGQPFPLDAIDDAPLPADLETFFHRLAYCQWDVGEIRTGLMWAQIRKDDLCKASMSS